MDKSDRTNCQRVELWRRILLLWHEFKKRKEFEPSPPHTVTTEGSNLFSQINQKISLFTGGGHVNMELRLRHDEELTLRCTQNFPE